MKKYSSYKSIKPITTTITYLAKQPQSPTHSSSYRKLTSIDPYSQKPIQKSQIYPLSAKYSNYANIINANNVNSTTNATRKKMFSGKNQQNSNRPLTLTKQNYDEPSPSAGYGNIRSKINDLQSRLNQIKKNYDHSYNNRKYSQKDKSAKNLKQNQKSINVKLISNSKNKQNQIPKEKTEINKQKKTQSKLLLQRYQTNKKLKQGSSASTINLHSGLDENSQLSQQNQYNKPPLSPKNIMYSSKIVKKTQPLSFNRNIQNMANVNSFSKNEPQNLGINSPISGNNSHNLGSNSGYISNINPSQNKQETSNKQKQSKSQQQNSTSNDQSSSLYLKQYVTTFTCDNKLPLSHSTSQTNLYKAHNKLSLGQNNKQNKNLYYVSAIVNAFESKSLTSFQNLCRNHLTTSLDILTYIRNAKKQPPAKYSCRPLPPVKDNRHSIIFDLDQTLIHCNENLNIQHDVALPIKFPNGALLKAGINVRPYAKQCIRQLAKYFQIIVFTASHQCYGKVICEYLDPNKEIISHMYFRDSCLRTEEGFYVKDLRVIDRDPKKLLLIDNAAYSYCFQLQNGIPIVPFYDNKADLQLKNLIPYLKGFLSVSDVRIKNQQQMKLNQYTNFKDVKTLINKLYTSQ